MHLVLNFSLLRWQKVNNNFAIPFSCCVQVGALIWLMKPENVVTDLVIFPTKPVLNPKWNKLLLLQSTVYSYFTTQLLCSGRYTVVLRYRKLVPHSEIKLGKGLLFSYPSAPYYIHNIYDISRNSTYCTYIRHNNTNTKHYANEGGQKEALEGQQMVRAAFLENTRNPFWRLRLQRTKERLTIFIFSVWQIAWEVRKKENVLGNSCFHRERRRLSSFTPRTYSNTAIITHTEVQRQLLRVWCIIITWSWLTVFVIKKNIAVWQPLRVRFALVPLYFCPRKVEWRMGRQFCRQWQKETKMVGVIRGRRRRQKVSFWSVSSLRRRQIQPSQSFSYCRTTYSGAQHEYGLCTGLVTGIRDQNISPPSFE